MSIVFHWPQIVWAVIVVVGWFATVAEAVLLRKADGLYRFVSVVGFTAVLLYAGGFFAGGVCL